MADSAKEGGQNITRASCSAKEEGRNVRQATCSATEGGRNGRQAMRSAMESLSPKKDSDGVNKTPGTQPGAGKATSATGGYPPMSATKKDTVVTTTDFGVCENIFQAACSANGLSNKNDEREPESHDDVTAAIFAVTNRYEARRLLVFDSQRNTRRFVLQRQGRVAECSPGSFTAPREGDRTFSRRLAVPKMVTSPRRSSAYAKKFF